MHRMLSITKIKRQNRRKAITQSIESKDVHGFDGPDVLPKRQTSRKILGPVTLVHTTRKGTQKSPPLHELVAACPRLMASRREKPHQLFWAKRLEGLHATVVRPGRNIQDAKVEPFSTGQQILPMNSMVTEQAALASLAAELHRPSIPSIAVVGQLTSKDMLDSNPGAFTNPYQPLVKAVAITDPVIHAQEQRVINARLRLELTMKEFGADQ